MPCAVGWGLLLFTVSGVWDKGGRRARGTPLLGMQKRGCMLVCEHVHACVLQPGRETERQHRERRRQREQAFRETGIDGRHTEEREEETGKWELKGGR